MKFSSIKYNGFLPLLFCMFSLLSCEKDFQETNTNPNAVTTPTPEFIFTKALYDGASNSGNRQVLLLGTMQYTTSYNDVAGFGSKYVAARLDLSMGLFNTAYTTQINEIGEVIKAVKDDPAKVNQYAMARIWRAYCFNRITDVYGDIPYTQAAQGYNESLFQPAYDPQKDIYADMLKELEEAAGSLDASNSKTFGNADLIYGGNVVQWKKFAYSLMLRLGMRLTKVDIAAAQSWVTKAIAGGVITDYADIAKVAYVGSGQNINKNPLAFSLLNDDYIRADGLNNTEGGKFQQVFIDSLKANNDPRLGVVAVVWVNGAASSDENIQKGMPSNINGVKPADFVTFSEPSPKSLLRVEAPLILYSNAETDFLLAEAVLRGWYSAETASALYEKGIRAAMQQWDIITGTTGAIDATRIDNYVTAHALNTGGSVDAQMEQIYNQFWVGIFPDAQEVFNNWRRTGYPALVPNNYPGNATGGKILRRFIYPTSEQTLNREAYNEAISRQGADDLVTRVWWDKP